MKYLAAVDPGGDVGGGKGVPPLTEGIYNPAINPWVGRGEGTQIIGKMISRVFGIMIIVGFIICFIYLFMGAFTWMTSGGDKQAVETARLRITYALIGLVILMSVWAIMLLLQHFFGITIIGGSGIQLPVPGP